MERVVEAFFAAGEATATVAGSAEVAAAWGSPSALAGYSVGDLAGHTLLATARLEAVLAEPPPVGATVVDLAGFYGPNRVDDADGPDAGLHPVIRRVAADAAAPGPAAVVAELLDVLDRLRSVLPGADPRRLVSVVNVRSGATPLEAYLRSRVLELVVHGDDLATSVGLTYELPPTAAEVAFGVCLELARGRAGDLAVLRAFTRRERAGTGVLRVL